MKYKGALFLVESENPKGEFHKRFHQFNVQRWLERKIYLTSFQHTSRFNPAENGMCLIDINPLDIQRIMGHYGEQSLISPTIDITQFEDAILD